MLSFFGGKPIRLICVIRKSTMEIPVIITTRKKWNAIMQRLARAEQASAQAAQRISKLEEKVYLAEKESQAVRADLRKMKKKCKDSNKWKYTGK